MIKIQDWIASIPDEDKHVAYVGEGMSESRTFLLCGDGWENYQEWSFHLDMAFDPESITTRDSRQVVQTRVNSTQMKETASVTTDEVTTKETYTVHDEQVLDYYLTDVASLRKTVEENGIRLEWTVLRQHTALPGKLWATLRAVNEAGDKIKKSAIMVFEVDAAICAVPAARPPISEMEQIEARVAAAADTAVHCADRAEGAQRSALNSMYACTEAVTQIEDHRQAAAGYAEEALYSAVTAATSMNAADQHADAAAASAANADQKATAAAESAAAAAENATVAANSAAEAEDASQSARAVLERCSRYSVQCEGYADKALRAVEGITYRRVNVRDYGAVADGVTDDRAAIIAAFEAAKTMLPCEVYFPAGTYGISNGITIEMAYGTGGLRVCGAGRDVTTIKYLESYDPNQLGNMWYAIRIWPAGMPNTKPATEEDYLHDISYTGLTVYDTDPIAHAWNTAKGDPGKEETHGFDIHFCKRVSVTDCTIINVGDEAIDVCGCHDVVVMNNHLVNCPAAGTAGGAISIGDGCQGVVVSGNTLNGSAADEILADGTVLFKRNFGIAVESLYVPVSDVVIFGNTIKNVRGNGVNIGATNAGSGVANVVVTGNVVADCCNGVKIMDTQYAKSHITISNNVISGYAEESDTDSYAIYTGTKTYGLQISGNEIHDTIGDCAVRVAVADTALLVDNLFSNIAGCALYTSGDVVVRNCTFRNTGMVNATGQAIIKYAGTANKLTVSGCKLSGVRQKKGILNADVVENTDIEMENGGIALQSATLFRVIGGSINSGNIVLSKDGAIVRDVTITSNTSASGAIVIDANGVSVTGCHIHVNTSKKAIYENDGTVGNLVANNVVNGALGASATLILADNEGTVCVNNIDLRKILA